MSYLTSGETKRRFLPPNDVLKTMRITIYSIASSYIDHHLVQRTETDGRCKSRGGASGGECRPEILALHGGMSPGLAIWCPRRVGTWAAQLSRSGGGDKGTVFILRASKIHALYESFFNFHSGSS
jgi:hypothetical protein